MTTSSNIHQPTKTLISTSRPILSWSPTFSNSKMRPMKQIETDPTGRYIRYDHVLGRGTFKAVYKAFDTHEAREVAWNNIKIDHISNSQMPKVMLEVDLLQRLDHNNIIKLFDSWTAVSSKGITTFDFVTELMSSATLKQYLTRARAIKLKVIRRWCHNLFEAISYLHSQDPP